MIEKDIKEEIYEYVSKFNLSDDEMKVIEPNTAHLIRTSAKPGPRAAEC